MIYRGTTPPLEFVLPFDGAHLEEVWITVSQNDKEIVTKYLKDCTIEGNVLIAKLTQSETLMLNSNYRTDVQLRVRTKDDDALVSDIFTDGTGKILKDGEI